MAGLQPYHRGSLSEKDRDFERQRFEHYVAMRATHLDRRALEAWELYHNDRDGTQTQYTREQIEMLQQVGAPQVSMNYIYPIMSTAKAVLTNDRPTGRKLHTSGKSTPVTHGVSVKLKTVVPAGKQPLRLPMVSQTYRTRKRSYMGIVTPEESKVTQR